MALRFNVTASDEVYRGEDKTLTFELFQSDNRTPLSLDGLSLEWMLKNSKDDDDADAVITKTTASGITVTQADSGICVATLASADTESLEPKTYYHVLKRTSTGSKGVLSYGTFALQRR